MERGVGATVPAPCIRFHVPPEERLMPRVRKQFVGLSDGSTDIRGKRPGTDMPKAKQRQKRKPRRKPPKPPGRA